VITAAMGVVAYPSLGIYKSIRSTFRDKTRLTITQARHEEALFFFEKMGDKNPECDTVLDRFESATHAG